MTVQRFITLALRDIGRVTTPGYLPSPDESNEGLDNANEILGSWSHEGLLVPTHAVTNFALTAGTAIYAMGLGATWNTAGLPIKVKGAQASVSGFEEGVTVMPMGRFEESIPLSAGITAALPSKMGIDNSAPVRNVRLWPMPNNSSTVVAVSYWLPLALLVNLTDPIAFAEPAFELALRNELSIRLARSFNIDVTPAMMSEAQSSKSALARVNPGEPVPAAPPQQPQQ